MNILCLILALHAAPAPESAAPNPRIDAQAFLKVSQEAVAHRASHRLSEEDFLKAMQEPGVILLDARSVAKFDLLHLRGAVNLPFPDIDIPSLARVLPDKNAKILIYCNNNFADEPVAMPSKMGSASLNVPTYITLYSYGYRNIFELAPLLEAKTTKLPLVRDQAKLNISGGQRRSEVETTLKNLGGERLDSGPVGADPLKSQTCHWRIPRLGILLELNFGVNLVPVDRTRQVEILMSIQLSRIECGTGKKLSSEDVGQVFFQGEKWTLAEKESQTVNLQIGKLVLPGRLNGNRLTLDPYTPPAEMADGGLFVVSNDKLNLEGFLHGQAPELQCHGFFLSSPELLAGRPELILQQVSP